MTIKYPDKLHGAGDMGGMGGSDGICSASLLIKDEVILNRIRRFRDNVLSKSMVGCLIITAYYQISPMLIRLIGKSH